MSPLTAYVVQTLVTLLLVVGLAVAFLVGARRLGVGRPMGPLALVGRLGLDGRRAIYLVRVGTQLYVVGASESGLAKLGELPSTELGDEPAAAPTVGFSAVLARVLAPRAAGAPAGATSTERDDG